MWSHYARGMSGLVLELDLNLAFNGECLSKLFGSEVKYRTAKELPRTNAVFEMDADLYGDAGETVEQNMQNKIFELLFTKADEFSYEKEWRLVLTRPAVHQRTANDACKYGVLLPFQKRGLKSIIFGMKTRTDFIAEVKMAAGEGPKFMQVAGSGSSSRLELKSS
jgi:hypothetical protein